MRLVVTSDSADGDRVVVTSPAEVSIGDELTHNLRIRVKQNAVQQKQKAGLAARFPYLCNRLQRDLD